ncbi:MAG: D-alanine-D-alanine ligase [Lentimonas sp.]|jgi:D-alanine-D-alanine ligase
MGKLECISVLYGGLGSEREVSLVSGAAIADALSEHYPVERILLDADALPAGIDASRTIVFPALHGAFGEDGRLQALCDQAGIEYCGSDAAASRLCMAKDLTKAVADQHSIPNPKGIRFSGDAAPLADELIDQLGPSLVIKPADEGSSVGLHFTEHRSALGVVLSQINTGNWLVEQRIRGRELTVGLLNGQAMGVVEIKSASGVYDFWAKYTPGSTEYIYPAPLNPEIERQLKSYAEVMFKACGCRDFSRIDFLLDEHGLHFLEINTLPGLTATSLLPKSASCVGFDFKGLAAALVQPAVERFNRKHHGGAQA